MNLCCLLLATLSIIEIFGQWKIVGNEYSQVDIELKNIERYWTNVFTNDILFTRNQSEPSQKITFYKKIDPELQLRIIADVRNPLNSLTYSSRYDEKPLILCGVNNPADEWRTIIGRLYVNALLPDTGCPTEPGDYKIYRKVRNVPAHFDVWPTCGDYTIRSWLLPKNGIIDVDQITDFRFNFQINDDCI